MNRRDACARGEEGPGPFMLTQERAVGVPLSIGGDVGPADAAEIDLENGGVGLGFGELA